MAPTKSQEVFWPREDGLTDPSKSAQTSGAAGDLDPNPDPEMVMVWPVPGVPDTPEREGVAIARVVNSASATPAIEKRLLSFILGPLVTVIQLRFRSFCWGSVPAQGRSGSQTLWQRD